jgi:hydroxymethylpyrimidine pyrophosphatase-like HAD family hydrolase
MKKNKYFNLKYPAVMFDIDDTLIFLSNEPNKSIVKLLNKCIKDNLIVIIITARDKQYTNETIHQLKSHNIKYASLFLRNPQTDDINTFKSKIKQKLLENSEITTIMSVGDNEIDVNGPYSGYFLKLPNNFDSNLYHLNADNVPEIIIN